MSLMLDTTVETTVVIVLYLSGLNFLLFSLLVFMTSQRKFYLVGICSSVQKGPKRNKEYDSRDYYYAKCPLHELIHHVWLPIWLNKLIARHWTIYTKKLLADMMIPWECFTTLNFQPCWHRCPLEYLFWSVYVYLFDMLQSYTLRHKK